eukprot:10686879-Karenia_brevis.AAC.1
MASALQSPGSSAADADHGDAISMPDMDRMTLDAKQGSAQPEAEPPSAPAQALPMGAGQPDVDAVQLQMMQQMMQTLSPQ